MLQIRKYDLFGVGVSGVTPQETLDFVMEKAKKRISTCIDHMPVHGLITASRDREFNKSIQKFDIVAPDGHPVRIALNHFYGIGLKKRVYGPDFMLDVCAEADRQQIPVFLYGATNETLVRLQTSLCKRYHGLIISGSISPPFRELSDDEDSRIVEQIENCKPGIVFVGTGCPKQELFAAAHRGKINSVMICVGAAFDFIAGTKKQAPKWMRNNSLEWFYRLLSEPKRLGCRYIKTNTTFVIKFANKVLNG